MPSVFYIGIWIFSVIVVGFSIKPNEEGSLLPFHYDSAAFTMDGSYSQQQLLGPALNVTVQAGQTALLACVAPQLGEKTVSWIRQQDLAILTSGRHVYTSDHRMASVHPESSDLWALQISKVRTTDEGIYQCQVNTEPKQSRNVVLIVLDPDLKDSPNIPSVTSTTSSAAITPTWLGLKILGTESRNIIQGSPIHFVCTATLQGNGLTTMNIQLAWWHGDLRLSDKNSNGRFNIGEDFGTVTSTLQLSLYAVEPTDSGTYYCKVEPKFLEQFPSKLNAVKEASVYLNVLKSFAQNCFSYHAFSLLLMFLMYVLVTIAHTYF